VRCYETAIQHKELTAKIGSAAFELEVGKKYLYAFNSSALVKLIGNFKLIFIFLLILKSQNNETFNFSFNYTACSYNIQPASTNPHQQREGNNKRQSAWTSMNKQYYKFFKPTHQRW